MKKCKICLGKPCVLQGAPKGMYISGAHIERPSYLSELDYMYSNDLLRKFISLMMFVRKPNSRFMLSSSEFVSLKYKIKDKLKEEEKKQNQERLKKSKLNFSVKNDIYNGHETPISY